MRRLIAIFVSCVLAGVTGAVTLENNRFQVTTGDSYPMLVYDQNKDVRFEVRSIGSKGWYVVAASTRGVCFVAAATVGEQVLDAPFENQARSIDSGPQDEFRFQFRWQYQESGKPVLYHYGWVALATNKDGDVVILADQVADVHGLAVVGQGEPSSPDPQEPSTSVAFKADFYRIGGERVAVLSEGCIDKGTTGAIVIPDKIDGAPVVEIRDNAFYACKSITSVEIPNTVTNIGYKSFCCCEALKSVVVPPSVMRIGLMAFYATAIERVEVPFTVLLESDAFPPDCTIVRTPTLIFPGDVKGVDQETQDAIYRALVPSAAAINGKKLLHVVEENNSDYLGEKTEPRDSICASAHLGISPSRIYTDEGWDDAEAYYRMPRVECIGFNPETLTLTGRVIPADGSKIVAQPLVRAFGFCQIVFGQNDSSRTYPGDDFGERFWRGEDGFSADFTDYVPNGVFRLTFPKWCATMKDPQPAHLFKIILRDHEYWLW